MWLKDPKTGEKSVSLTAFAVGFVTLLLKLLLSGVVIKIYDDKFSPGIIIIEALSVLFSESIKFTKASLI